MHQYKKFKSEDKSLPNDDRGPETIVDDMKGEADPPQTVRNA